MFTSLNIRTLTFRLATILLVALTVTSCSDYVESPENGKTKEGYITIKLSSTSLLSRAENGVDDLNENLIKSAMIYLFPAYACSDSDRPIMNVPVEFGEGVNSNATVEVKFSREVFDKLYTQDGTQKYDEAFVFAIVNMDNAPAGTGITLGGLKSLLLDKSTFSTVSKPQESFVMHGSANVNIDFAEDLLHSTVSGNVELNRTASKMRLAVSVAETVTDDNDVTWISRPDGMLVYMNNGVDMSRLEEAYAPLEEDYFTIVAAEAQGFTKSAMEDEMYPWKVNMPFYSYPNNWTSDNTKMTYFTLVVPWQKDDETQVTRNCYYMVPVVRDTFLSPNVSYQVNINVGILGSFTLDEELPIDDCSFRAVNWKDEEVGVDIKDYRYLVLEQSDYVLNNETSNAISFYSSHETVVKDIEVTYNRYNFSNIGLEQTITMNTSQVNNSVVSVGGNQVKMLSADVDNTVNPETMTRTLNFYHTLDQWYPANSNDDRIWLGPNEDGNYPTQSLTNLLANINKYLPVTPAAEAYSIYNIKLTIVHQDKIGEDDEPNYTETINITQYPAMYIDTDPNAYVIQQGTYNAPIGSPANHQGEPVGSPEFGSVYINNNTRSQAGGYAPNFLTPIGLGGSNRNPNMYLITVTQLEDDTYIIGDPRTKNIQVPDLNAQNFNFEDTNNRWVTAEDISGVERTLLYYYPTDNSSDKRNFIAPKLRIASSYGVSPDMTYLQAQIRCAGYQEKDCPAGRWRIPTYGELEYIIKLSDQNKIPKLFSDDSGYWTATGAVLGKLENGHLPEYTGTPADQVALRCVYDEWYWGDSKIQASSTETVTFTSRSGTGNDATSVTGTAPKYPFTWGDAPR